MSIAAVQEFLGKVSEDQALQKDLAKALEAENDRQAVTDLAKSKGYDFSSEELAAEVERRQQEVANRQEAGELSDEELEAVAGGACSPLFVKTAVATIIATGSLTAAAISKAKW